jgi:hypothetical protein
LFGVCSNFDRFQTLELCDFVALIMKFGHSPLWEKKSRRRGTGPGNSLPAFSQLAECGGAAAAAPPVTEVY